jgi:hypothetical protein
VAERTWVRARLDFGCGWCCQAAVRVLERDCEVFEVGPIGRTALLVDTSLTVGCLVRLLGDAGQRIAVDGSGVAIVVPAGAIGGSCPRHPSLLLEVAKATGGASQGRAPSTSRARDGATEHAGR